MSLNVGDTGIFTTTAITIPNVNYTITAINTIANLINIGLDVVELAYIPYGLSKVDYEGHTADTQIYTMQNELGESIHLPEPYLAVVSENGYIEYADRAMVINLGSWPDRTFNGLQDIVTGLVTQHIGVIPTVKISQITRPTLMLLGDYDYIDFKRKAVQSKYIDPKAMLKKANIALDEANAKIDTYQAFITKYLKHCKKRCDEVVEPPFEGEECESLLDTVFKITCPCRYDYRYPERPRQPLPKPARRDCGGIVGVTFKRCSPCISPISAYFCKSKTTYTPVARPITRIVVPCTGISHAPFNMSMKICPIPYHSNRSRCST